VDVVTPRLLSTFLVLSEELHFGRAAKRLGISQSTVSEQLRVLEAELDTVLFDRHSRGVALTAIGRKLIEPAQRIIDDTAELMRVCRRAKAAGELTLLGVQPAALDLGHELARLVGADLDLRVETLRDGLRSVTRGDTTAYLCARVDGEPLDGLVTIPVHDDVPMIVMSPEHHLAAKPAVTLADLVGAEVLLGPGYLAAVTQLFSVAPGEPTLVEVPTFLHALGGVTGDRSVAVGLGWLTSWGDRFGLVTRPLDPPVPMTIGFVVSPSLSGDARHLLEEYADLLRRFLRSST